MVPDLLLPPETEWNHFAPELIPDFTIPKRFDPVLGTNMPVKILIWHTVGRNLFRTVTDGTEKEKFDSERVAMLNKGVSVFNYNCMRPTVEHVPPGGNPSISDGLPLNPLTQVVVGDGTHDVGDGGDWNKWIAWWARNVDAPAGPLGAVRPGKPSPIYMTCADYEGMYTAGADQDSANHLVVGTYAMLERTTGYAGQMYLGPLNTLGYTPEDLYTGGHQTFAWFKPSNDGAPEKYRGKKMDGNPRIPACLEVAFSFESLLPEGYRQGPEQQGLLRGDAFRQDPQHRALGGPGRRACGMQLSVYKTRRTEAVSHAQDCAGALWRLPVQSGTGQQTLDQGV